MEGSVVIYCGEVGGEVLKLDLRDPNPRFQFQCGKNIYSRTSLSRTRLFRITAYLEVKIWSLF